MSSFEWMELQSLNSDITASRSRLSAARANKDHRLTRVLEQEIAAAEARRARLVAHITTDLAGAPEGKNKPPIEVAPVAAQRRVEPDTPAAPQVAAEKGDRDATKPQMPSDHQKGETIVWDRLTSGDVERAKRELGTRRAEILARHAEELRTLDADQAQLDALEQAIDAFMRKFNSPAVVELGEMREARQQAHA